MRIDDKTYQEIKSTLTKLQAAADNCDTLSEFINSIDGFEIYDRADDDEYLEIEIDSVLYTIEATAYGMEASSTVMVLDGYMKCWQEVEIDMFD